MSVKVGAYFGGISAVSHCVSVSSVSTMTRPIGSIWDAPTAFSTSHRVTNCRLPTIYAVMYDYYMALRTKVTHPLPGKPRTVSVTLDRDMAYATMRNVPRGPRRVQETPESLALDAAVHDFHRDEERLKRSHARVIEAAVAAVRKGMPKAEAARRIGYSREYFTRLFNEIEAAEKTAAG